MNRRKPCHVVARLAVLAAACWLWAIGGTAVFAANALPAPVDVPRGPEGVLGPGGAALPPLAGKPADAPAISAISDVTFPDETLVIAGDRLSGAQLRVWTEGRLEDLLPLRTASNRMRAVRLERAGPV